MGSQVQTALLFETPEQIYARVYRELKPRSAMPEIAVSFRSYASANSFIRLDNGHLEVKISDALQGAPAPVQEALAQILLGKLLRRPIAAFWQNRYRRYLNRADMRRTLHLLRQERGRKRLSGPGGDRYNLQEVFESLNERFFNGLMARPELSWSPTRSRTTLGHYDPSHNAIVISRVLDSASAPRLAVDYVMYHEMLHLRHPVDHSGARRRVHTPEFRADEKRFPEFEEAKRILKEL